MLGAALLVLALAAPSARAAADPQTLDYAIPADIDTLDPHWAYDALSLFVIDQVYETLVDFSGSMLDRFEPRVASVVPTVENGFLSPDGLSYAFPLRKGMTFHDGSPVTPEDVKYSLMRFVLLDRAGGPSRLLAEPLLGTTDLDQLPGDEAFDRADKAIVVEGGALVLRLRRPFAPLMSVLAGYGHVVPRAFVAANGGWDGRRETWRAHRNPAKERSALYRKENGSGPFRVASWDRNVLALERAPSYWRSPAPLQRVRLLVAPDARVRRRLLEKGEVDVAALDRRALEGFQATADVRVTDDLPALEARNVILFNQKVAPEENPWIGTGRLGDGVPPDFFADVEIRKAFAQSFDYDAFIKLAFHGKAVQARGPIPAVLFAYNPRQQQWRYAPELAAAAFQKIGGGELWAKGFTLSVGFPEGVNDYGAACRVLRDGLAKVNPLFRVDCRPAPESRLLDEFRARRLPCFVFRWVLDYPDPHNAVEPFLGSSGYFASQLGYANPRADALIAQGESEPDPARRKAVYFELQALAGYDVPALFTADSSNLVAYRAKVRDWLYHPIKPYGSLYAAGKLP